MTDHEFRVAIRSILLSRMADVGLTAYRVLAEYQTTSQGRDRDAVYFFTVSDNRHGWQGRKYSFPATAPDGQAVESQQMQTTLQFGAFVTPGGSFTALDLVNNVAMLINSMSFAEDARAQKIGVQRATNIRTPYFKNDQDRFEPSPSFDVTFSYRRTIAPVTPFIDTLQPAIHRV